MRHGFRLCTAALALTASLCLANPSPADSPATGKKVPNLTFKDAAGKSLSLYDLKDKKAIVVVFLSFDCPISTSYCQPLADIHKDFQKYGVECIGLITNQDQTAAEVAKLSRDFNLPFPVFLDRDYVAADAFKAEVTPEVFVLDGSFVLRYRGRIDDSYYARLKKNHKVTTQDLQQALGELMSGRPVSHAVTEAIGCDIVRQRKVADKGQITYYRDVLPILQNHCQSCHRPGEVGPFALMTYRHAVQWASDIKEYTQTRQMPPWKIAAGADFHNDRRIPAKEIATLAAWVDGGTPEGNPKDAPPPRLFPQGWQLGQPDLVLKVSDEFQLGPSGRDVFRCFVLPTNLPEDCYIGAVEVRPGNTRIVHHALLFVDTSGQGRKLEQRAQANKPDPKDTHAAPAALDKGPGYSVAMGVGFTPKGGLSGWAPGNVPRYLPEGYGFFLPKGADVVIQVHYHRDGRLERDRTQVGLYFAKKKDSRAFQGSVIAGQGSGPIPLFFTIPAGDEHFKLAGRMWATDDCTLYSIMPHMHMLGKQIKVTATTPDGKSSTLVEIKDWDYNWQETYWFKQPLQVKAGTRLDVEAFYDNSAANPRNPFDPPRRVTFGEQTTNEMCFVFLGGTSERPIRGRRALPLSPIAPKKTDPKQTGN